MLADLSFAIHITTPIFCILGLGIYFKRRGLINDEFAKTGSELVFKVTLPCLLFVNLVETDFRHLVHPQLFLYAIFATVAVYFLLEGLASSRIADHRDRGVFVQGAFRGNMGIIGLAYCLSAFGEKVLPVASIYLAFVTTLYNVLAVMTLTRHQGQDTNGKRVQVLINGIVKNPLILAIAAGVILSLSGIVVPEIILKTGSYFAQMTLPLALLCAGAAIRLREFQTSPPLYWGTAGKLLLVPLLITVGGIAIGLRGESLGILFLMVSAPTAAASYPMAQAFGANHHLAAAIIAATTLGSIVSSTLGIFLLRVCNLI